MRSLFLLGLMLATLVAGPGAAVGQAQAPGAAESCPRPGVSWTATEANVWQQVCAGRTAEVSPPNTRLEPPQAGQPLPAYVLSAAFLQQILSEPPYRDAVRSVRIAGALVTGLLDLNKRQVPMGVVFERSHFLDGITVDEAQVAGEFSCIQCSSPRNLVVRRTVINGRLNVSGTALEGPLDLGAAIINGDLLASGGKFAAVVGRGMQVRGTLDLDGVTSPEYVLGAVQIGGDARMRIEGAETRIVHLAGARVTGDLGLAPRTPLPANARIDLSGTRVGALTPPAVWPAGTEARDLVVDRVSPTVATWILERLNRATRADVNSYRQLSAAATAAGNSELARQIDRTLRQRQRAEATASERFWMTVEDLGWFAYAAVIAVVGAILWLGIARWRRNETEKAAHGL